MSGSRAAGEAAVEVFTPLGAITLERFFGGWAPRCDGHQFAIVMDDLYLRVDTPLRTELETRGSRPFSYQARGRTVHVRRYWSAPTTNETELRHLARRALAAHE